MRVQSIENGQQNSLKALQENPYIKAVIGEGREALVSRPIDARWHYHDIIQKGLGGFNPLLLRVFYPQNSCISEFINNRAGDPDHNNAISDKYRDTSWLPYEVFYCVHDYIHCRIIAEALTVFPPHFFDLQRSGRPAIYRLAYCLWLSEVAATVGLDYWYLCCPWNQPQEGFQSRFTALTTQYRHSGNLSNRLDRFVQSKDFFRHIFRFYSSRQDPYQGHNSSLMASLGTEQWYVREQRQANLFTKLIASWLARTGSFNEGSNIESSCQHTILLDDFFDHITDLVWKIFKEHRNELLVIPSTVENPLYHLRFDEHPFDPRFWNIHRVANWKVFPFADKLDRLTQRQFAYLVAQFVASFHFDNRGNLNANLFDKIVIERDIQFLREWASSLHPITPDTTFVANAIVFPN